ncbi:hypothetical protein B0T22DRAFT_481969 [Podospora appendiculata]|uniref:Uncharacterized protein n=1 Tax=Podospora appendiculata TaxID=314037 RepID=A0AAE1C9Y9_9PEZI|nr:hypothetical protein B0T22DRAFT_481969 [Podospora appendiculata]
MPANFKTYESQARLLAATIAAHPDLRLNYRAIAQHYGQSHTASALEHRFRPVRTQAEFLRQAVAHGEDPESINFLEMNKAEIAKYFGDSTPDGLQFQFRAIKASSEAMKAAVERGEDPIAAFNSNKTTSGSASSTSTPGGPSSARKRARPAASKTTTTAAAARASTPTTASAGPKRRAKAVRPTIPEDTDRDESSAVDYDALDESPTKQIKKLKTTPAKTPLSSTTAANSNNNRDNNNDNNSADSTPIPSRPAFHSASQQRNMERTPSLSDASATVGTPQDTMANHPVESIFGGGPISHNGNSNNVKKEPHVDRDDDDDGFVMFTPHPVATAMHASNNTSNNNNNTTNNTTSNTDTTSTPFQMFAAMPTGERFDLTGGYDYLDDFGHDTGDI